VADEKAETNEEGDEKAEENQNASFKRGGRQFKRT